MTHAFLGDGVCNDETNNAECSYDGGDCCPNHNIVGDTICHDETNTFECGYDGFDCCGSNVDIDRCTECACHGKEIFINICNNRCRKYSL